MDNRFLCNYNSLMGNIKYEAKNRTFRLTAGKSIYCFGVNREGALEHIYFGKNTKKIKPERFSRFGYHDSDRRQNMLPEVEIYDGRNVFENTVKASFSGGIRMARCVYSGHKIKNNTLEILLADGPRGLYVTLRYTVWPGCGLIEKSICVRNVSKKNTVTLENCFSGSLVLRPGEYKLGYLSGAWAKECNLTVEKLNPGKKVLESRGGNSGHIYNPSFFITGNEPISEESGEVYFGQLLWSGNFKFVFEKRFHGAVVFHGGINDFDSDIILKPGSEFTTPPMILGFSGTGLGDMSRRLHDFYRDIIMPEPNRGKIPPVPVNSWEGFYFKINENNLKLLADKAAGAGAEALVIDDGWFGKRNSDKTSLGDWETDLTKFPSGMERTAEYIKSKGLKFGIWIEPEMVSPESMLYGKHPDWAYNYKGIKSSLMRNQLVLNITKPAVKEFVKNLLKKITLDYGADFVKWDMNRYISEAGADNLAAGKPVWVDHVRSFYGLMDELRKMKPGIILEGCAGGGGRFDGGMLKYADCIWTSDNTDASRRQFIQHGVSLFYPARAMDSHVSDIPNWFTHLSIPLSFRLAAAMAGNFGIQANILKWGPGEFNELKKAVAQYKRIRDIVFFGGLYRLISPYESTTPALMYASKDGARGVVFVYNLGKKRVFRVYPRGLQRKLVYYVSEADSLKTRRLSGAFIMDKGLPVRFMNIYDSVIVELDAAVKLKKG